MNLFTICIPTYNRSGFLDKALGALLPQVASAADKGVGVYVSNNCSTDNTEEVVQKYQALYPGLIQYKRQTQMNLQHFVDVTRSVSSKYIALMGDDDFVMPGYVEQILASIDEHPDVGLINYNIITYRENQYFGLRDPLFLSGKGKIYENGGEFVKEHHHFPSLMSSNVFKLEDYLKEQEKIVDGTYFGYDWYMALLKSVLHKPCLYIDEPLVWANMPIRASWDEFALRVYMSGLCHLFKDLDAECLGLYEKWNKVFATSWLRSYCLELALRYRRTTSRQYFDEIIQYAYSPEFAKELKICVFYPLPYVRVCRFVKNRLFPFIKHKFNIFA